MAARSTTPKKPPKPKPCSICKRPKEEHTICPVCRGALEHGHDPEYVALEWEGKARSAMCKRDVLGEPLSPVELEALARYPSPRFLNGDTLDYTARYVGRQAHGAA